MGADVPWIILGAVLAVCLFVALVGWLAALTNPSIGDVGRKDPFTVLAAVLSGRLAPAPLQTVIFIAGMTVLTVTVVAIALLAARRGAGGTRVDRKAASMAQARDLAEMTTREVEKDTARLGADAAGPGVPLGNHVPSDRPLFGTWEWVQIWLMGPRAGKTSCVCVPQILETRGPVIATSNKRDVVDLTRGPRSELGQVWVHDVQDIIGAEPTWWWDPLTFVKDLESAERLVDVFRASAVSADAKADAYFDPAAKETLSRLFLAAAEDGRPIIDVFRWANDPSGQDPELGNPSEILVARWYDQARALAKTQTLTEKQRDGVYGTVRTWIGVLGNEKVKPWITDTSGRPHFDPYAYATSTDTLYAISKEGGGSARAITAALTMAVLTAAEEIGSRMPGGRLRTPLLAVLDETANVCRWPELPDVYSHYGSRGIIISTFFQSWKQGVEAFGVNGMDKLWGAANVRAAGRGLADDTFLPHLSQLIGDHDVLKRSVSVQRGGRSTSTTIQRERIFDVSDLAAMPRGRAVIVVSGQPAALLALQHWSTKPYGAAVRDSGKYYEGQATRAGRHVDTALEMGTAHA
jgi:hypothetical protein